LARHCPKLATVDRTSGARSKAPLNVATASVVIKPAFSTKRSGRELLVRQDPIVLRVGTKVEAGFTQVETGFTHVDTAELMVGTVEAGFNHGTKAVLIEDV